MKKILELHICMKFFYRVGETVVAAWNLLEVAFGDEALSKSALFEWYKPFKSDQ